MIDVVPNSKASPCIWSTISQAGTINPNIDKSLIVFKKSTSNCTHFSSVNFFCLDTFTAQTLLNLQHERVCIKWLTNENQYICIDTHSYSVTEEHFNLISYGAKTKRIRFTQICWHIKWYTHKENSCKFNARIEISSFSQLFAFPFDFSAYLSFSLALANELYNLP